MQAVNQCSVRKTSNPFLAMFGWVIVASLAVSLPHAGAQDSLRVGIVDPQVVLEESNYGKRAIADLKEHSSARQKILSTDEKELKKLRGKLQESQDSGGTDLPSLQKQLQRTFQKYQERGKTFQQELTEKQNTVMTEYMEKFRVATEAVAERQDFALIIDKGNEATLNIVLYASQGLDITKDVLKEFETLYP